MSGTEHSLYPHVFWALAWEWRIPWLDLFTTRWNHHFTFCVPRSRSISHGSRCSVNELEDTVGIRIPTTCSVATGARAGSAGSVRTVQEVQSQQLSVTIWLILAVVIRLSGRLSNACLSTYLYTQPRGVWSITICPISSYMREEYPGCFMHQRLFGRCFLPCL